MDSEEDLKNKTRKMLRAILSICECTSTELGRAAGLAPSTINRFLNNKTKHTLSAKTISKIAQAARKMTASDSTKTARLSRLLDRGAVFIRPLGPEDGVIVMGHVEASDFREAVEWPDYDHYSVLLPPSKKFPRAPRYGLEVRGDSMNLHYPAGTILICVSIHEIDYDPVDGDKVIVQRRNRFGMYEATCKEFVVDGDTKFLSPKSTNPRHQTPIELTGGDGAEDDVQITGLVIGAYREE